MPRRFSCPACGEEVVTYMRIGETADCRACGEGVEVPEGAETVGAAHPASRDLGCTLAARPKPRRPSAPVKATLVAGVLALVAHFSYLVLTRVPREYHGLVGEALALGREVTQLNSELLEASSPGLPADRLSDLAGKHEELARRWRALDPPPGLGAPHAVVVASLAKTAGVLRSAAGSAPPGPARLAEALTGHLRARMDALEEIVAKLR